ncbi:MAG: Hsp20/alpha crystallin family protein [Opitutaceae bacterium]
MNIIRYRYPAYRSLPPVSAAFSRSPWGGLESEIDRLFAASVADYAEALPSFPVDLYEDPNHAYVRAELPGVNRDDIQVEMTDGVLTITAASKTPPTPATGSGQVEGQVEQSTSVTRSLTIPTEISADQVTAAYENGILTVTLPKREEAKPKKITVAVK